VQKYDKVFFSRMEKLTNRLHKPSSVLLLEQADLACPSGFDEKNKSILASLLDMMPEDFQNAIDGCIYKYSQTTDQDLEWGRHHRLDNPHHFRAAIYNTLALQLMGKIQNIFTNQGIDRSRFYITLHQIALGPEGADPTSWVNANLPYLGSIEEGKSYLIEDALATMSKK
jgi:hypothetical protein